MTIINPLAVSEHMLIVIALLLLPTLRLKILEEEANVIKKKALQYIYIF